MSKIKKLFAVVLCALGIFMLVGCSGNNAYMPNPFVDCKDIAAAKEIAGFEMTVPETINGYKQSLIQAIKKEMIQVIFKSDNKAIYVRKAAGSNVSSLNGDYNDYSITTTYKVDNISVTVRGNENGKYYTATWSNGGYSYSVTAEDVTLAQDQITNLVKTVK